MHNQKVDYNEALENILDSNPTTIEELEKSQSIEFNIFKLQESSNENELISICSYLMRKHNFFT